MDTQFENSKLTYKDEWLTPPELVRSLGPFDLDPCSPVNRPWDTAAQHYTKDDDGLMLPWSGRVWCNPPYGNELANWLNKCALHKNCIALVFARVETNAFFNYVWPHACGVLFIKGRVRFYDIDGNKGGTPGAPSMLIAFDQQNARCLKDCGIAGKYVEL